MLNVVSKITIIKNKSFNTNEELSYNFNIPNSFTQEFCGDDFIKVFNQNKDVAIEFNFVNDIEVESSFKAQTQNAKIIFPRKLKQFEGLDIAGGDAPIFKRGDRIIIEMGYDYYNITTDGVYVPATTMKEVFRGYITSIKMGIQVEVEAEDMMFGMKQIKCMYPTQKDAGKGKLNLKDLLQRLMTPNGNPEIKQDLFVFNPSKINTATYKQPDGKIPVVIISDVPTPFTYSTNYEKSLAEVLSDLKKKLGIFIFFDDFGNLRFELPFNNNQLVTNLPEFIFEKTMIDYSNMKYQKAEDYYVKVIAMSKPLTKKSKTIYGSDPSKTVNGVECGFWGDKLGDTITINLPPGMSQADCNKIAQEKLKSEKYTGYAKGSSFITFGDPRVYVGDGVKLISEEYPEKGGNFMVVGVTRRFGMNGFRQEIEIGIEYQTK